MKIDVTAALNKPGKTVRFDCSKEIEPVTFAGEEIKFISPVKIAGKLMYTSEDFMVKGEIFVQYIAQCNRCTKKLINELEFDFSEEFSKQEDEDHPDRYLFSQNEIDLELMAMDNISLMMPMKHVCDIDCKGLCPVCGGNLNDKNCDCLEEQRMNLSPFAKMKELFFEDNNKEV